VASVEERRSVRLKASAYTADARKMGELADDHLG